MPLLIELHHSILTFRLSIVRFSQQNLAILLSDLPYVWLGKKCVLQCMCSLGCRMVRECAKFREFFFAMPSLIVPPAIFFQHFSRLLPLLELNCRLLLTFRQCARPIASGSPTTYSNPNRNLIVRTAVAPGPAHSPDRSIDGPHREPGERCWRDIFILFLLITAARARLKT